MHIGFGNMVPWPRVAAILSPKGTAAKRLRDEAARDKRLLDARAGRKCRGIVVTDSNQVILSANTPEVLQGRLAAARVREQEAESGSGARPRGRLGPGKQQE